MLISNLYLFLPIFPGLKDKRAEVVSELRRVQADTEPIVKIFEDPEVVRMIQTSR